MPDITYTHELEAALLDLMSGDKLSKERQKEIYDLRNTVEYNYCKRNGLDHHTLIFIVDDKCNFTTNPPIPLQGSKMLYRDLVDEIEGDEEKDTRPTYIKNGFSSNRINSRKKGRR